MLPSSWACLPGDRVEYSASPNTRDCSAVVFPEAKLGTDLQHGRKTSLSLPGHSFFASAWGRNVGDAWSASGKGLWSWPASPGTRLESKGRGGVAEAPVRLSSELQLLGLFGFYYISLQVFNQQESAKQALWCNNSACFVINIPRQS